MATNITLNSSNVTEVKYKKGSTTTDITEIQYKKGSSGTATSVWKKSGGDTPTVNEYYTVTSTSTYNGTNVNVSVTVSLRKTTSVGFTLSVYGYGTPVFCGSLGDFGTVGCVYYEDGVMHNLTNTTSGRTKTITFSIPKYKVQTSEYRVMVSSTRGHTEKTASFGFDLMPLPIMIDEIEFTYNNGNTDYLVYVSDEESFDGDCIEFTIRAFQNDEELQGDDAFGEIESSGYSGAYGSYGYWYGEEDVTFKFVDLTLTDNPNTMFTMGSFSPYRTVQCIDYTSEITPFDVTSKWFLGQVDLGQPVDTYILELFLTNPTANSDFSPTNYNIYVEKNGVSKCIDSGRLYAGDTTATDTSSDYLLSGDDVLNWVVEAYIPGIYLRGITEGSNGTTGDSTTTA